MNLLREEQVTEIVIKKSRFICYLQNVESEDQAKDYIANLKKENPAANHCCSAYKIGPIVRVSDDGEPSQTAGMPMLGVIEKNDLDNVVAVVVRYFGGIKLGGGGLIRAYSESVATAIAMADIAPMTAGYVVELNCGYGDIDKVNHILKINTISDYKVQYGTQIIYNLKIKQSLFDEVKSQIIGYNHTIKCKVLRDINIIDD